MAGRRAIWGALMLLLLAGHQRVERKLHQHRKLRQHRRLSTPTARSATAPAHWGRRAAPRSSIRSTCQGTTATIPSAVRCGTAFHRITGPSATCRLERTYRTRSWSRSSCTYGSNSARAASTEDEHRHAMKTSHTRLDRFLWHTECPPMRFESRLVGADRGAHA